MRERVLLSPFPALVVQGCNAGWCGAALGALSSVVLPGVQVLAGHWSAQPHHRGVLRVQGRQQQRHRPQPVSVGGAARFRRNSCVAVVFRLFFLLDEQRKSVNRAFCCCVKRVVKMTRGCKSCVLLLCQESYQMAEGCKSCVLLLCQGSYQNARVLSPWCFASSLTRDLARYFLEIEQTGGVLHVQHGLELLVFYEFALSLSS